MAKAKRKSSRRRRSAASIKAGKRLAEAARYCAKNRGKQKQTTCVKNWFKKN